MLHASKLKYRSDSSPSEERLFSIFLFGGVDIGEDGTRRYTGLYGNLLTLATLLTVETIYVYACMYVLFCSFVKKVVSKHSK